MLKSAFTAFLRAFTRHPQYALLNLLGLSFGIAVFITLSLFYRFETSYESWSSERPYIYAMGTRIHFPGIPDNLEMSTMGGFLDEMKATDSRVDGTRDYGDYFIVHRGAEVFSEHVEYVDANFLTFFKVPVLRGDPAGGLADPSHVVVSAAIARKYFGTIDVVGRAMTLGNAEGIKPYTVSAVIGDLPANSDLRLDMLHVMTLHQRSLSKDSSVEDPWFHWGAISAETYVKLQSPAAAQAFSARLPAFVDRQAGTSFGADVTPHKMLELHLVPLAGVHLNDPKLKAAVAALGLVGILALGLALINYVNLATARAGLRAREVAVRKTLGAPPTALRRQFLVEAVLTLLLAFLIALSAVELGLPLVNAAGGLSLALDYRIDALWILELLSCVLAVGLVAALYPALVLSAFKPASVLASSRTPGGGRVNGWLRTGLAMLQFAAVVVTFILMAGCMLEVHHIQTNDLGFQRDHLLIVGGVNNPDVTRAQREAFLTAARGLPAVRYASAGGVKPGAEGPVAYAKLVRPGQSGSMATALNVNATIVGPDYFQLMGAHLLAGRLFDRRYAEDQTWTTPDEFRSREIHIILGRRTARELGFASPQAAVGQVARFNDIGQVRIIGVVDDLRLESPHQVIPPQFYMLEPSPRHGFCLIRYQGVSEAVMRQALDRVWRQINPDVPLDADSAVSNLDVFYKPERERSHLFDIGTGIAALIGCIGLYGMAAFNASRRVREVGMRKVLGASRGQMVRLLLLSFLRPVVVASLIAWPLGWIALKYWLGQFDDVIAMPLWLFPSASVAALLIALLAVAGTAFAAAGAEPGKALRHE